MAAIEAGRRGRRVLVLDHADKPGKKILISGGGRCNFTNLGTRPENFLSANPHFAKSALAAYTPHDFLALVEKHRIRFHEKTLGQLFCDGSAREIVTLLEAECAEANVRIQLNTRIHSVQPGRGKQDTGFTVETSSGPVSAESVVVATGGLSIPKMGATGLGYDLALQFGLRLVEPRPALVPFTLRPQDLQAWCDLSGVSALVTATVEAPAGRNRRASPPAFREKLLVTHRGLSGPAILQISSYWNGSQPVTLDLAPDQAIFAPLTAPDAHRDPAAALAALKTILPTRWAERWLQTYLPADAPRQLGNALLQQLEAQLHAWRVTPAGTEGYEKAEVTAGGVDTADLDARTLAARHVPGLYFIGEVVDVTGWLGGYNFQWAWASGAAAGRSA
jgi:predicted Rossmann fold flavoprotein